MRFILLGGGGRGRFGDDLEGDDLGGDDLHDEACEEEVELVADIVDTFDNDDDDSPIVLLRRGSVECIIFIGIVIASMYNYRELFILSIHIISVPPGWRRRVT